MSGFTGIVRGDSIREWIATAEQQSIGYIEIGAKLTAAQAIGMASQLPTFRSADHNDSRGWLLCPPKNPETEYFRIRGGSDADGNKVPTDCRVKLIGIYKDARDSLVFRCVGVETDTSGRYYTGTIDVKREDVIGYDPLHREGEVREYRARDGWYLFLIQPEQKSPIIVVPG